MSDAAETPQQRQARIRQQKREAKIKASAQERLDKITKLSGRTPESIRNEVPATEAAPTLPTSPTPAQNVGNTTSTPSWMSGQTSDAEQMRLQEEYMKVLLGGTQRDQSGREQPPGMADENEQMVKMMQAMLGGMSGDPNAPGADDISFSPDDISKMTGIPSFVTNMFMGRKTQAPPTPEQVKKERRWKMIRTVVSVLMGLYTVITINTSIDTFGQNPPAPATIQNPFAIFIMGELLLHGAKTTLAHTPTGQSGIKSLTRTVREISADGAVLLFIVGVYSWLKGFT